MTTEIATSRGADFGQSSTAAVPVGAAADSELLTLEIPRGATRLYLEVKNLHGSVVFDQFTMKRRPHASADWETIADVAGDYSSPQVPLLEVSGTPVTLAAGATTFIRMDVEGTESVQILASGSAPALTADLHYRIQ